jgi:hypothetical protein
LSLQELRTNPKINRLKIIDSQGVIIYLEGITHKNLKANFVAKAVLKKTIKQVVA